MLDAVNNTSVKEKQLEKTAKAVEANYKGHRYSCVKFSGRVFLGLLAVFFSGGFALLSNDVTALFSRWKRVKAIDNPLPPQLLPKPVQKEVLPEVLPEPIKPAPKEEMPPVTIKPEPAPKEEMPPVPINLEPAPKEDVPPVLIQPAPKEETAPLQAMPEPSPALPGEKVQEASKVELDPDKKLLLEQFSPAMVEALGGIDAVYNFPILKDWDGVNNPNQLTAPVMRGYWKDDLPFLIFGYLKCGKERDVVCEALLRKDFVMGWNGIDHEPNELSLRFETSIPDGSLEAKYLLDKIRRLIKGEAIGQMQKYVEWPKKLPRPENACLEGEALTEYMNLRLTYYERKPLEGRTELFLWDPRIGANENLDRLIEKFPAMKKAKEPELDPEKKALLEQFSPAMVEALGGIDAFYNLPVLENWNGNITKEYLTAPMMRGFLKGQPFLLFCYGKLIRGEYKNFCECLIKREGKNWVSRSRGGEREFDFRSDNPISDGSEEAKYMVDKMNRLMKGEAIGTIEVYPNLSVDKPENLDFIRPAKAYLQGDDLTAFMKLDFYCYERKPRERTTEIFLWDPRISEEDNLQCLYRKFPA